jgi:hypothetical protein
MHANLRRIGAALVLVATMVAIAGFPQPVHAGPSSQLVGVLSTLRNLFPPDFAEVVNWARAGAPQVSAPVFSADRAKAQILNLGYNDRTAVLSWLNGHGRAALYARGATDAQIGPPRPSIDAALATPNPWRQLTFATETIQAVPDGNTKVLGGFAAVRRNGRGAIACVSFQNDAPVAATRVLFEFPLLDDSGRTLTTLTLDRQGTFSTGIGIMTYSGFSGWQTGGPRGYADNCARLDLGVAALPLLTAKFASYRIVRIEYADGTSWPSGTVASPTP